MRNQSLNKIISGAQTGVDRAALDVSIALSIPCGGWCPADRSAQDGIIPAHYPIQPLTSGGLRKRTQWNVRDSDGTLIVSTGPLTGGSLLTHNLAHMHHKPCFVVDLDSFTSTTTDDVWRWIESSKIETLNIAGPSEATSPGIYERSFSYLQELLAKI